MDKEITQKIGSQGERMNVSIYTLGCKSNQYDSAILNEKALLRDINIIPPSKETEVFVINTCTVTARTDYQARQIIRRFRRLNPSALLVVTGCYAQVYPDEVSMMDVDYVVGNKEKERLWEIILKGKGPEPRVMVGDIRKESSFTALQGVGRFDRTRAYLKIQDGCDAFCSYCIIPFARGKGRSLPEGEVLKGIDSLVERGFKEIILTGIHLGSYGKDLGYDDGLAGLLGCLYKRYVLANGERRSIRFRLSSLEPMEITDKLIELIVSCDIFCPHFHIPLQSGSNRILEAMKRPYTSEDFKMLISKINSLSSIVSIGLDVMVGFPGESDDDFLITYKLLSELPVSYLHVFPFSRRKGTQANLLPHQVEKRVVKDRCERFRELGRNKKKDFYKKNIGRIARVLVENRRDRKTGLLRGFTRNYIPVLVKGDGDLMGKEIGVRLNMVREEGVLGSIEPQEALWI